MTPQLIRYQPAPVPSLSVAPHVTGFGSDTTAGRGGRVIVVSTLEDAGPGSYAKAMATPGPRQVVFDVTGAIRLPPGGLRVAEGQVSVYGQTAPGDGVEFRASPVDGLPGYLVHSDDMLHQHCRFRAGPGPAIEGGWSGRDPLVIGTEKRAIGRLVFDHCTMSWGTDEVVDIHSGAHHVTLSNCLIYEGLAQSTSNHLATDAPMAGKLLMASAGAHHLSIHRCVLAMGYERLPQFSSASHVDFLNNIVYGGPGSLTALQFLNPISGTDEPMQMIGNLQNNLYILPLQLRWYGDIVLLPPVEGYSDAFSYRLHIAGNRVKRLFESGEKLLEPTLHDVSDGRYARLRKAIAAPRPPVLEAQRLEEALLDHVGASRPRRDTADRRVIDYIRARGGNLVDCVAGGVPLKENNDCARDVPWPLLRAGPSRLGGAVDSVPAEWKRRNGLDADADTTQLDSNDDGFTDFEDWAHQLARID